MTDRSHDEERITEQVASLWARALQTRRLAAGDTLTATVSVPSGIDEQTLETVRQVFLVRGLTIGHTTGAASLTVTGTNLPAQEVVDREETSVEVLRDIFDLLAVMAQNSTRERLSLDTIIALLALLVALLPYVGLKP